MCGIYITNLDLKKDSIINKINRIKFRGPDNTGYSKVGKISVAHLRLSIIDLDKRSNQPFYYDGLYLTYNGEVYNYKEIRAELINLGYKFKTTSDTEVILISYHKWGRKMLHKMNGMFSFSIYDSKKNIIFSARDRLGVKPFYYTFNNGQFEISSQISPLETNSLTINNNAISAYLKTGYIPSPLSIYNEINKLSPGCYMIINLKSNKISIKRYWDLKKIKQVKISYDKALIELEKLINDSVKIRLNSDVAMGTYLSGGIDSALIASIASKISNKKINTFTVGFEEAHYDESKLAKTFSKILNTNHKNFICKSSDLVDLIPHLNNFYDEPFADSSAIPSMFINKKAKNDVTVVLSGDGGDESFFGYNHFFISKWVFTIFKIPYRIRRVLSNVFPFKSLSFFLKKDKRVLKEIFILKDIRSYIKRIFISQPLYLNDRTSWFDNYESIFNFSNNIFQNIADLNIKLWLENDSNVKVDRASMAYSVEVRSPFLDYRIIEFARSLPVDYRYSLKKRKKMLKDILKKYIPEQIFDVPKKGFSVPIKEWSRNQLKNEIKKKLNKKNLKKISGINIEKFQELMYAHFNGSIDFSLSIWRVYVLILWFDKNTSRNK
ncbi:MAG: asparagine synthase (glutamine-hydrolyzing) [Flammeovirgaceae bacterium]